MARRWEETGALDPGDEGGAVDSPPCRLVALSGMPVDGEVPDGAADPGEEAAVDELDGSGSLLVCPEVVPTGIAVTKVLPPDTIVVETSDGGAELVPEGLVCAELPPAGNDALPFPVGKPLQMGRMRSQLAATPSARRRSQNSTPKMRSLSCLAVRLST